jgi:tRNA U34 2-thiouridine synthase MnmA/TrmU
MVNEVSQVIPQFTIYNLQFTIAQRAITPGQICVVYDGDVVVGSGVIV